MTLLTVSEVAEQLGLPATRVYQLLRDHGLVALRGEDGKRRIPADFLLLGPDGNAEIIKGLSGVLTLLSDARYTDEEAMDWRFTSYESLAGKPIEALRAGRGTAVRRHAQALGF